MQSVSFDQNDAVLGPLVAAPVGQTVTQGASSQCRQDLGKCTQLRRPRLGRDLVGMHPVEKTARRLRAIGVLIRQGRAEILGVPALAGDHAGVAADAGSRSITRPSLRGVGAGQAGHAVSLRQVSTKPARSSAKRSGVFQKRGVSDALVGDVAPARHQGCGPFACQRCDDGVGCPVDHQTGGRTWRHRRVEKSRSAAKSARAHMRGGRACWRPPARRRSPGRAVRAVQASTKRAVAASRRGTSSV